METGSGHVVDFISVCPTGYGCQLRSDADGRNVVYDEIFFHRGTQGADEIDTCLPRGDASIVVGTKGNLVEE